MSAKRYTEEFKIEAVKQVSEHGHPVAEVAARLGVTSHSLYQWIKRYSLPCPFLSCLAQRRHSPPAKRIHRLPPDLKTISSFDTP